MRENRGEKKRIVEMLYPCRLSDLLILITLALGLFLRTAWPTLAEFKLDEATVVRRAMAIAWQGELPVLGMGSSTGMANLPLTLYLTAIPLRIWSDPVAAVVFIGLLNGLAVAACYWLGERFWNRSVGGIAAFLFALNPWAVLLARKIWPRILPLVTVALVAALMATFVRQRRWALVGAFAALAALVGLQLEGIAFIPVLVLCLLLFWKEVPLRPLLVGIAVFTLALAPYGIYDALHGWPNLRTFWDFVHTEKSSFSWDALRYAFILTGSAEIHTMAGTRYEEYLGGLPRLGWLNTGMMGLLALALIYAIIRTLRGTQEERRVFLILLLGFAVPVALRSRAVEPIPSHYLIVVYPTVFLLIAALIDGGYRALPLRYRPAAQVMGFLLALLWGAWQLAVLGRLFWFMDRYPTTGGYGIPLKYPRQAALEARQIAQGAEIVVLSDGTEPAFEERPAVFDALLFRHPHRLVDGRMSLLVPDAPRVVYIVGPVSPKGDNFHPIEGRLRRMASVRETTVSMPDGWQYHLYLRERADREDVLAGLTRPADPPRWANGIVLLGYDVPQTIAPGSTLEVWLAWWVQVGPPPGSDYHFFVHLLDGEGHLLSQHDGVPFPTSSWRAGDLVLSRFTVPIPSDLPPGPYPVRAGLYTYPDIQGVPVVDAIGHPIESAVLLGTITVRQDQG
ncbi:MAG: hypothetical protein RML46_08395 [Anaerolineae bacterium]|nr:hypothetical protein [Anaerolineae bacterium]MDW8068917.1 hypothetical protein [Anaerolineae bacterium]